MNGQESWDGEVLGSFGRMERKREGWKEVKRGGLGMSMDGDAKAWSNGRPFGFVLDCQGWGTR